MASIYGVGFASGIPSASIGLDRSGGQQPLGNVDPGGGMTDAQHRCVNGVIISAAVHGVASALGVGAPGSDPAGDLASAAKDAAENPMIRASAGILAAQLGNALLSRAGAMRLAALVSENLVLGIGWIAGGYLAYSAVKDAANYYKENIESCH